MMVFCRALKCTTEKAQEYVCLAEFKGRWPVMSGTLEECQRVNFSMADSSAKLHHHRLDVVSTSVYRHQLCAQLVLKWVVELAGSCDGFRAIICDVCLQDSPCIKEDNVRNKEKRLITLWSYFTLDRY